MAATVSGFENDEIKALFARYKKAHPFKKSPSVREVLDWKQEESALLSAIRFDAKEERAEALSKAEHDVKMAQLEAEGQIAKSKVDEAKLDITIGTSINKLIEGQCASTVTNSKVFNQLGLLRAVTSIINPASLWKF